MGRLRVTKAKKSNAKKKSTPEQVFGKLWKQVQNEQLLLSQLPAKIQEFYTHYSDQCGPLEAKWCQLQEAEIELLLSHWPRKSLNRTDRMRLVEYIADAIGELQANPFCTLDVAALMLKVRATLIPDDDEALDDEANLFDDKTSDKAKSKSDSAQENQSDFFEESESANFFDEDENEGGFDNFFEEHLKSAQQFEKETASDLFNATSLNKMFRQLSKVLHPDLEQDEEQKIIKHNLMAQLLVARDKQDVGTIVTLYSQYIGGDGTQFSHEDFPRLTVLLKKQLRDIQFEKQQLARQSGMQGFIYDHYHHKNPARQKNSLNARQSVLEIMCDDIKYSLGGNTTVKSVKQFLSNWDDERMDNFFFDLF